jgi:hypothetical protein
MSSRIGLSAGGVPASGAATASVRLIPGVGVNGSTIQGLSRPRSVGNRMLIRAIPILAIGLAACVHRGRMHNDFQGMEWSVAFSSIGRLLFLLNIDSEIFRGLQFRFIR